VSNTPLKALPQNMRVGGSMILRGCLLDELPEFIEVCGDLDLSEARVPGLTDGLRVRGSLNMYRTRIDALPDDMMVDEVLYLVGCKLKRLPRNLKVMKNLVYARSMIGGTVPKDLFVGGRLIDVESAPTGFGRDGLWFRSDSEANTLRATLL
jgi:hypothetical protein